MSKDFNVGLFNLKTKRWHPFEGARIAKPTPYFTDAHEEAFRQWIARSASDKSIVLKRATTGEMEGATYAD